MNYEVDAKRYGYADIEELKSNTRNKMRVMFKLTEHDGNGFDYPLGTQAKNTSFRAANFCGSGKKPLGCQQLETEFLADIATGKMRFDCFTT